MEDTDNPVEELEPEAVEEEATEEETEPELDEDGNPIEPEEDDSEEVEYEGKTYKLPRELKDAVLRQADYTRKTQEVADQRRELEQTIERLQTNSQEETQALAKVAYIDSQIAQYENIDWNAWDAQDPLGAIRGRQQLTELRQQRDGAANEYGRAREQTQLAAQQEAAKRIEQGQKVLSQKIPGWGPDKARAILDFGVTNYGFTAEELQSIDNPLAVLVLHDAMEGAKVRKQTATKAKIETQQQIKPAPSVKGKGGVGFKGLDDRLPVDEWMKRRNAEVRKR